jgi:hypothetical protein
VHALQDLSGGGGLQAQLPGCYDPAETVTRRAQDDQLGSQLTPVPVSEIPRGKILTVVGPCCPYDVGLARKFSAGSFEGIKISALFLLLKFGQIANLSQRMLIRKTQLCILVFFLKGLRQFALVNRVAENICVG